MLVSCEYLMKLIVPLLSEKQEIVKVTTGT